MTDQDARLDAAQKAVLRVVPMLQHATAREIAAEALYAADKADEVSKWPTDQCVSAAYGERADLATEEYRVKLRHAMMLDPVIKAALEWHSAHVNSRAYFSDASHDLFAHIHNSGAPYA